MSQKKKISIRAIASEAHVRAGDNGKKYVDFYAAVFNSQSKLIREWGEVFYEIIAPGAFDNVLADTGLNTIATIDHHRGKMLGRVKSGTLEMTTDSKGLKCTLEMPDTTMGNDMLVMIERGDYFECSFIYTIAENGVKYDRGGEIPTRTVTEVLDLIDVSFVVDGAFANTDIKARALRQYQEEEPEEQKREDEGNILLQLDEMDFSIRNQK